jgi:hypothetical protein
MRALMNSRHVWMEADDVIFVDKVTPTGSLKVLNSNHPLRYVLAVYYASRANNQNSSKTRPLGQFSIVNACRVGVRRNWGARRLLRNWNWNGE